MKITTNNEWISVFPGPEEEPELKYEDFIKYMVREHATDLFDPRDPEQLIEFLEKTGEIGAFARAMRLRDQPVSFYKRLLNNEEGMTYCVDDFFENPFIPRNFRIETIISIMRDYRDDNHLKFLNTFRKETVLSEIPEGLLHPLLKKQLTVNHYLHALFINGDYSCFFSKNYMRNKNDEGVYERDPYDLPAVKNNPLNPPTNTTSQSEYDKFIEANKALVILQSLRSKSQMNKAMEPITAAHEFMRKRSILNSEGIDFEFAENIESKNVQDVNDLKDEAEKRIYYTVYEDLTDEQLIEGIKNGYADQIMLRKDLSIKVLEELAKNEDLITHMFIAKNDNTTHELLERLMDDELLNLVKKLHPQYFAKDYDDSEIRAMAMSEEKTYRIIAALHPDLPHDLMLDFATDEDPEMRLAVMLNEALPLAYSHLI